MHDQLPVAPHQIAEFNGRALVTRGLLLYASGANLPVDNSMHARLDRSINVACLGRFECGCGECVLSIADTYRAMSDDIKRAAKETNDEGVRRAYGRSCSPSQRHLV